MHKLTNTEDGSHTLVSSQFGELYHSRHGALTESNHVFIKNGLLPLIDKYNSLSIFEMGLGTGLNLLLTIKEIENKDIPIHYTTVETFPVSVSIAESLNYSEIIDFSPTLFQEIHSSEWNKIIQLTQNLSLLKIDDSVENISFQNNFDLIYYDAFAPATQPELWSEFMFKKIYDSMNQGGVLVTYSAKGQVKRNLKSVGFTIESLAGPPGKREMTRATKL